MQIIPENDIVLIEQWRSYTSIQRWSEGLLNMTGLTPSEVEDRQDILFQFCIIRGFDPEVVANECRHSPDRHARRAYYLEIAQSSSSYRVFQSFLVHNGVNIFGELICMPSTPEQLVAEQGQRWAPRVELHLEP